MKTLLEGRLLELLGDETLTADEMRVRLRENFFSKPTRGEIKEVMDNLVLPALDKAYNKHPLNMVTLADAIEISDEEYEEFIAEARKQEVDVEALLKENLHWIAMSIRTLLDVTLPLYVREKGNGS